MRITPLSIEGAWVIEPALHRDDRGVFLEWYRADHLAEAVGHPVTFMQSNVSTSTSGAVRGIHFADVPPSQSKYVTCVSGAVADVVVDVRTGSPTYGRHEVVVLDDVSRKALFLSEGLGHGYMALTDGAAFLYLCSAPYTPTREHGIDPFDPDLGIAWPARGVGGSALTVTVSTKDAAAPGLTQSAADGSLPRYDEALAYRRSLAEPRT